MHEVAALAKLWLPPEHEKEEASVLRDLSETGYRQRHQVDLFSLPSKQVPLTL